MENNNEMYRPNCPVLDIDGFVSNGKQFDIDVVLPDVYVKMYHNSLHCLILVQKEVAKILLNAT